MKLQFTQYYTVYITPMINVSTLQLKGIRIFLRTRKHGETYDSSLTLNATVNKGKLGNYIRKLKYRKTSGSHACLLRYDAMYSGRNVSMFRINDLSPSYVIKFLPRRWKKHVHPKHE
jgi:hypothetical protein